jgi:hypothetical protein
MCVFERYTYVNKCQKYFNSVFSIKYAISFSLSDVEYKVMQTWIRIPSFIYSWRAWIEKWHLFNSLAYWHHQSSENEHCSTGVDVMNTIFCDFSQFSAEKIGVFLKNQCYDQNFAYFSFVLSQKRQFFAFFSAKIFYKS